MRLMYTDIDVDDVDIDLDISPVSNVKTIILGLLRS